MIARLEGGRMGGREGKGGRESARKRGRDLDELGMGRVSRIESRCEGASNATAA